MDQIVCDHLKLDAPAADMTEWRALEEKVLNLKKKTKIALVGKYVELPDAYISVVEALKHAGFDFDSDIEIDWVDSQELTVKMSLKELVQQMVFWFLVVLVIVELKGKLKRFVLLAKMTYHSLVFA